MPLFQGWPVEKLKQLNLSMTQQKYQAGDIIYDLNESPDKIFILLRGELTLETELEIEQTNQFPIVSPFAFWLQTNFSLGYGQMAAADQDLKGALRNKKNLGKGAVWSSGGDSADQKHDLVPLNQARVPSKSNRALSRDLPALREFRQVLWSQRDRENA
jgi:hypothetical protein